MDWQGALALGLAAVGTAVSVYTAYAAWRDRRPRLAVRLAYGAGPEGDPALVVTAVNRGALDVAIGAVGLVTEDGRRLAIGQMRCSIPLGGMLRAGEGASCWIGARTVERALMAAGYVGAVVLRAYVLDAMVGEHRSAPVPFEAGPRVADAGGVRRRR